MKVLSSARNVKPVLLSTLALLASFGCVKKSNPTDSDSEVAWLASSSLSTASVNKALSSKIAFKVNLTTNRVTLYKDGVAVDQWNIASADTSGAYHNGEVQYTPTGIYAVDDIQMCPAWYPRNPVNPATGRVVRSEAERASVFANNPSVFGACGARNPLGRYVLWFNGAYGLHGNSNESILELPTANDRRVSGGCIRNPNQKIQQVVHTILDTFSPLQSFADQVTAMESRAMSSRWTITKNVSGLDMRVVVGRWSADPQLNSSVDNPPVPVRTAAPGVVSRPVERVPTQPNSPSAPVVQNPVEVQPAPEVTPNKQFCNIGLVDSETNIAPVYLRIPSATATVSSFYRMGWPVTVWGDVAGTDFVKVGRGFLDKKYLTNCSPAI